MSVQLTPAEEAQLRRLVDQAFALKGTGYLVEASAAIVDWHEQRQPAEAEPNARVDRLVAILRETDVPEGLQRAA